MNNKFYIITICDEKNDILYRGLKGQDFRPISGIPDDLSDALRLKPGRSHIETYSRSEIRRIWDKLKEQQKSKDAFEKLLKSSGKTVGDSGWSDISYVLYEKK